VVENAAAVVAGLKAERARKAVAEVVGRARARAVRARGVDIAAVEGWRGELAVVVVWRRRVEYVMLLPSSSKALQAPTNQQPR
jgi:hypothetical protein